MRKIILIIVILTVFVITNLSYWKNKPDEVAKTETFPQGRSCYTYSHGATKDEPYDVSEFLDITISGSKVSGTKKGTQAGPDMTNGYNGTVSGSISGDTINSTFTYSIEGSYGKEDEIYRSGDVGLEKLRYPLIENGDKLVPDISKEYKAMTFARVDCEASN